MVVAAVVVGVFNLWSKRLGVATRMQEPPLEEDEEGGRAGNCLFVATSMQERSEGEEDDDDDEDERAGNCLLAVTSMQELLDDNDDDDEDGRVGRAG